MRHMLSLLFFLLLQTLAVHAECLQLAWHDNANNEWGFVLERQGMNDTTWTIAAWLDPDASTYTDNGLTAGGQYCYQVRAFNASGSSDYSTRACGTAVNPDLPANKPLPVVAASYTSDVQATTITEGDVQ